MAQILLVGMHDALLEGVAQTLASGGHRAVVASSLDEAAEVAPTLRPLMIVVERRLINQASFSGLVTGDASLVLYRDDEDVAEPLPVAVQRLTLAFLSLPLERNRLVALVTYLAERARVTGGRAPDAPEGFI